MKRLAGAGLGVALWLGLTGCGAGDEVNAESMPNPGEEGGQVSAMASVTKTLYYGGSCEWLRCATGGTAAGDCGYGCDDTRPGLTRDYEWRMSCGKWVFVYAATSGRTAWATVWDTSCCGQFEGTRALMDALGVMYGEGWCVSSSVFVRGSGQTTAMFSY